MFPNSSKPGKLKHRCMHLRLLSGTATRKTVWEEEKELCGCNCTAYLCSTNSSGKQSARCMQKLADGLAGPTTNYRLKVAYTHNYTALSNTPQRVCATLSL